MTKSPRPVPVHDPLEGVSGNGMIETGARRGNIPVAFRPLLEKAVEHLNAIDGVHSLYLYGSVATGVARVGRSDVDLVTIGLARNASRELGESLTADFPGLCRGVEVGAAELSDYDGVGDKAYGDRVFLRHYCVHLAGPDVAQGWPEFPADRAAARGFNGDIGRCAARWRAELPGTADPGSLARRIGRKTLFAVAALVSVHDTTWTTDRLAAARRWATLEPRLAGPLDLLVAWGNGARESPSRSAIESALGGVVADVVDAFERRIGLWRSTDG